MAHSLKHWCVITVVAAVASAAAAPAAPPAEAVVAVDSVAVTAAVTQYRKQVSTALQPLYAELSRLQKAAAAAPSNPPGLLMPPSPVETIDAVQSLYSLAALPDAWRAALLSGAQKARFQGMKDKAAEQPAAQPHARFEADFAGRPRGLALPQIPRDSDKAVGKSSLPLASTLAALEKAAAAGPDSPEFRAYQNEADRFCAILKAKVVHKTRGHLVTLRGALAKVLPEKPPDFATLPDDLRLPTTRFLASHYYEGYGGRVSATGATGTGSGDSTAGSLGLGTGSGDAKEPGATGTGSGDAPSEPSEAGTGTGTSTPDVFKDKPGTGTGKAAGPPTEKGTGK